MANNNDDNMQDIPGYIKSLTYFVKQAGFPVLAFLLMFYMSFTSLQQATDAITANTTALIEFSAVSKEFQHRVESSHDEMAQDLEVIKSKQ